ncbi:uncharacterized protein ISCGN_017341 [Ixodes scapularis]
MPKFHEFRPDEEMFDDYLERFQIFVQSLSELTCLLKNPFSPAKCTIAERTKFHRRYQKDGESLADFVIALKKLAMTCDFGEFFDTALRDRFVAGCLDAEIQRPLLEMDGSSKFSDVYKVALARELATEQSKELQRQSGPDTTDVHRLWDRQDQEQQRQPGTVCSRCGSSAHEPLAEPLWNSLRPYIRRGWLARQHHFHFTTRGTSFTMFSKVLVCCLFAFAASQVVVEHHAPQPYSFGYDNVDEFGTRLTRQETGDVNNNKVGSYGYVDASGVARTVNYVADAFGYRATVQTNEPGTKTSEPADAPTFSSSVEVHAPTVVKAVHPAPVAVSAVHPAPVVYGRHVAPVVHV